MRRLILLSSCRTTFTSHRLEVPPVFKMPPPLVRWCLRLVVTMPLVAPLLLILLTIRRLLSANPSPPVGLLFASWLLRHPCCRAAAASCPLNMPPPPCNKPPPPCNAPPPLVCWCLSSCLPLFRRLVVTSHLVAPPPQVLILDPCLHLHQRLLLCIMSHCFCLPSSCQHCCLSVRWQLTSRLPLVCPNWLPVCLTWYAQ